MNITPAPAATFFLAPLAHDVGLTSMALGLVRALQRDGIKAGFVKPIAEPPPPGSDTDLSSHFARRLCQLFPPKSIPFATAEMLLRTGQVDALMEDVVTTTETVRANHDVVVVEGLVPDANFQFVGRLNSEMARSLSASLVLVLSGAQCDAHSVGECLELARRQFADDGLAPFVGLLVNKLQTPGQAARLRGTVPPGVPLLGAAAFDPRFTAFRLRGLAQALGFTVLQTGNLPRARVSEIVVMARSVEHVIERLKPGALIVTPADRSDVVLAVALAAMSGVPLAGLLLTCGGGLAPPVANLLASLPLKDLAVLATNADTFATSAALIRRDLHVGVDDAELMDQLIDFIAEQIDPAPLIARIGGPRELRVPPPAFRHRLVQAARAAARRIVLPEGDEPRTVQAAVICQQKRIATCVLLGDPARIRQVAAAQGLELPAGLEIVDPETVRARYVAPMVELRRSKGLTPGQAEQQLEDNVVLGTMMLAQGEVHGLVSGAMHTTANTVRPALQLIKTAPGNSIVSSVFFMLLPDQVLVYGDCAVNPNPTAAELAEIALQSADSATAFGIAPRVAMISYSTGSSGSGADVDKVREATKLARERRPELLIDGPMQYDAASVESVGRQKAPDSLVAGHANVFIFPDLNTGNTTYKAVQRSAHVVSVGPMLQGLRKPVNDLSRGALVDDIVYTIALTAIQAQQSEEHAQAAKSAA
jgi:phosphate acetyltransferase